MSGQAARACCTKRVGSLHVSGDQRFARWTVGSVMPPENVGRCRHRAIADRCLQAVVVEITLRSPIAAPHSDRRSLLLTDDDDDDDDVGEDGSDNDDDDDDGEVSSS